MYERLPGQHLFDCHNPSQLPWMMLPLLLETFDEMPQYIHRYSRTNIDTIVGHLQLPKL